MELTFPYAQVFVDSGNRLNVFFRHDAGCSNFRQIGAIGSGIVDFCELDLIPALNITKALETMEVTGAGMDAIKSVCWEAVDTLKDKHSYAHFFLNGELLRTFYISDKPLDAKVGFAHFLFRYYAELQALYREALELCLSAEVLAEYTLPERYVMFGNLHPDFQHQMLRAMYAIAPVSKGRFDADKLISVDDPDKVDARKVLRDIHADSKDAVSMQQYFAVQSLEEMLFLELMEMVKRGVRVKRCALCDRYFVLADKRRRGYCDRVYRDGRTCQQVGPKQRFNREVEEDQYLQGFQQTYSRMYSRYYREDSGDSGRPTKKLTREEFGAWISAASEARRAYKRGEITGEELMRRIKEAGDSPEE